MVGFGELQKLPMLDPAYPEDVSVMTGLGLKATFEVSIAIDGNPAVYSYQWYIDGNEIVGATSNTYSMDISSEPGTHLIYCEVSNGTGVVTSRNAILTILSSSPLYTFSGSHELIEDDAGDWRIKLKSSGTLKLSHLGKGDGDIEVFLVGGGGGGYLSGGGGGKTTTSEASLTAGVNYSIIVGGGGEVGKSGGVTSAFGKSADGGEGGTGNPNNSRGGTGGCGGGAYGGNQQGGNGGSNGSDGYGGYYSDRNGSGQGTSTYEFGDSTGTLYAGGGGGSGALWTGETSASTYAGGSGGDGGGGKGGKSALHASDTGWPGDPGVVNTGGGGGGDAKGGSGIVVIRNKR